MYRQQEEAMKSAAVGMLLGAAVGAVGTYVAQQHPKEIKKAVKKVSQTAEHAMENFDRMMKTR